MRRADRLFMIVALLRPARLMTARDLGARLEVSERTIYRDIADLIGAGVPIDGAAEAGYLMRAGYDLPPLMLTRDEAAALMAGARILRTFGSVGLSRAASEAMDKIAAVLPPDLAASTAALPLHVIAPITDTLNDPALEMLSQLEDALQARVSVMIDYSDSNGTMTRREVLPAALFFCGNAWTFSGWCNLRKDIRMFRVDRILDMQTGAGFSAARARKISIAIEVIRTEHP
jgi:predicted DNA-binding transcriptional regulator YafY